MPTSLLDLWGCQRSRRIVSRLRSVTIHHVKRTRAFPPNFDNKDMLMNIALTPLLSLIAGILILIMPRLLNYIVAIYLIVIGVAGLVGGINLRL
jgi:hypothetical protein